MRVLAGIAIVVALGLGGCFESHDPMNQAVAQDDCYTCHVPEYNATGTSTYPLAPPHEAANCGTQCAQCHTTQQWHNGLGNDLTACTHPEDKFPLASQGTVHTTIKCVECHSTAISDATGFTSVKGANHRLHRVSSELEHAGERPLRRGLRWRYVGRSTV